MCLRVEKSTLDSFLPSDYHAAAGPLKKGRVNSDGRG